MLYRADMARMFSLGAVSGPRMERLDSIKCLDLLNKFLCPQSYLGVMLGKDYCSASSEWLQERQVLLPVQTS